MRINNLDLQIWLNTDQTVTVRIEHDIKNGSAISSNGANLVEALQSLAIAIKETKLSDPVWKMGLISGESTKC